MAGSQEFERALFVFRRDLRLMDNTGLALARQRAKQVIPCFIVDPRQAGEDNAYRSPFAVRFLRETLASLSRQLNDTGGRLYLFYGQAEDVLAELIPAAGAQAVFLNKDYTPFSTSRDLAIKQVCGRQKAEFFSSFDVLLHEPHEVSKAGGGPYTVFTPFFRRASQLDVRPVRPLPAGTWFTGPLVGADAGAADRYLSDNPAQASVPGGREAAQNILKRLAEWKDYEARRDTPADSGTTRLSAHLKFGTVSVREVYQAMTVTLGRDHPLLRQLYWRDFLTHIAFHFPYVFGQAFQDKYQHIRWHRSKKTFAAWCEGRTGLPIVDAGMRELNATGFMHNRVRMITASFLVKDLHIDWRWGERYFATKLVDYDPCVNNGNWQWAASTGCDAQPYFRIFNPWRQQARFDPDAVYIKRWLPELRDLTPRDIHRLESGRAGSRPAPTYPRPIVEHKAAADAAKALFKAAVR